MVEVKLQKRISRQTGGDYISYAITLPKMILDLIPEFSNIKNFDLKLEKGKIILTPKRR